MMRGVVVGLMLLLSGCAEESVRRVVYTNPQAALDAAKIAEGAYLASKRATPDVLAHLIALDRAAMLAIRAYHQQPTPEQAQEVQLAIAALANYLSSGARL